VVRVGVKMKVATKVAALSKLQKLRKLQMDLSIGNASEVTATLKLHAESCCSPPPFKGGRCNFPHFNEKKREEMYPPSRTAQERHVA